MAPPLKLGRPIHSFVYYTARINFITSLNFPLIWIGDIFSIIYILIEYIINLIFEFFEIHLEYQSIFLFLIS